MRIFDLISDVCKAVYFFLSEFWKHVDKLRVNFQDMPAFSRGGGAAISSSFFPTDWNLLKLPCGCPRQVRFICRVNHLDVIPLVNSVPLPPLKSLAPPYLCLGWPLPPLKSLAPPYLCLVCPIPSYKSYSENVSCILSVLRTVVFFCSAGRSWCLEVFPTIEFNLWSFFLGDDSWAYDRFCSHLFSRLMISSVSEVYGITVFDKNIGRRGLGKWSQERMINS